MSLPTTMKNETPPDSPTRRSVEELRELLSTLYRRQLEADPADEYLRLHGDERSVRARVFTFAWYAPFLPPEGAVLDWGCRHAPDACLLRAHFGERFELHGCDVIESTQYRVFHDFARFAYTRMTDPATIPYPARSFDTVIAAGVLEHVPMDYEALKEVYRVLKPDGLLIVTYLPKRLSIQEWAIRTFRKQGFHRRLYGVSEARDLLKRSGFHPIHTDHQFYRWESLLAAIGIRHPSRRFVALLKLAIPVHRVIGALALVARKVEVM